MSTTHWPGRRWGSSSAITVATALPSGSDSRIRSHRAAISTGGAAVTPFGGQARQRLRPQVVRQHRLARAAGEMAAHRLAHHAEPDEAKCRNRSQIIGFVRTSSALLRCARQSSLRPRQSGEGHVRSRAGHADLFRRGRIGPGARTAP